MERLISDISKEELQASVETVITAMKINSHGGLPDYLWLDGVKHEIKNKHTFNPYLEKVIEKEG